MLTLLILSFALHASAPKGFTCGAPQGAPANARPAKTLVVLLDAPGAGDAVGREILEGLHKTVDASADFVWRDPPSVSADELVVALSCKRLDEDCAAKLSGVVQADAVLLVALGKGDEQLLLTLAQVHPKLVTSQAPVPAAAVDTLPQATPWVAQRLLGPQKPGALEVVSSPVGAQLWVDGVRLGAAPLRCSRAPLGVHQVEARAQGVSAAAQPVEILPGATAHLSFNLAAAPVAQGEKTPDQPQAAATPAGRTWVKPVTLALWGTGAALDGLGALVAVAALAPVVAFGAALGAAYNIQRAISIYKMLTLPSLAGAVVLGLSVPVVVLGAALLAAGVALRLVG